jgi:dTDP-4-dehydrorhamnose reductase
MTILVLGGEGMLGHKMYQTLLRDHPDVACTVYGALEDPFYSKIDLFRAGTVIEKIDVMALDALDSLLRDLRPTTVVNCIGIIKQRAAASSAIPSITLNSLLPHRVAETVASWGGRLFHVSTDCVFSGRDGNYLETSPSDAEDLYGKTKFLGEVTEPKAITLRTSIIGRELSHFRSLLDWFLSQRGQTVKGFTRTMYSGVTTNYLARVVSRLISNYPDLTGLFQVVSRPISKHDLLGLLRNAYGINVEIVPDEGEKSDRTMRGEKFLAATGCETPSWPALVEELASDPTPYDKWRA